MSTGWKFSYYLWDRIWRDHITVVFSVEWFSVPREFNTIDLRSVIQQRIQGAS